jgi:hypothetical protein
VRYHPGLTKTLYFRSQLAGWDGIILSDTFSIRQYCGHVNFTKSLAVNDATIVSGGASAQAQAATSTNTGPAVAAGTVQGIPPDIASIPNIVSPSLQISFSSKS